jgi:hypothetical protein
MTLSQHRREIMKTGTVRLHLCTIGILALAGCAAGHSDDAVGVSSAAITTASCGRLVDTIGRVGSPALPTIAGQLVDHGCDTDTRHVACGELGARASQAGTPEELANIAEAEDALQCALVSQLSYLSTCGKAWGACMDTCYFWNNLCHGACTIQWYLCNQDAH